MSNGARRAPQEIKMLFAVLPETKSQGLFHQIHKEGEQLSVYTGGILEDIEAFLFQSGR